ncbi:ArsR/SmtB family transcription factor [Neisseria weaveri]|uniref:ArsR/SmtB family transcription factor n=1 Tax=Neisseria weaveri TaxID=28091 RepID=UPI0002230DB6|nr:metalloregulator ArsR/SmtB family transcription factor [Neisseria weaveri]EGV36101.1 hypothetical protein l13_11250 [Neisseria weaveri ATCC 51223]
MTQNHIHKLLPHTKQISSLFKSISNPHRFMILCLLAESEKNVSELMQEIGINQTAVSNHLAKLRSEGLVDFTRYHRVLQYRILSPEITRLLLALQGIYCPVTEPAQAMEKI